MTAEIVIMNKAAVAMAADSAVTTNKSKIYNSSNKLFMLSKYHPVGIMIFGNAEFMNIPFETIIKVIRNELGAKKFGTLNEYAEFFIDKLESGFGSISNLDQIENFKETCVQIFFQIVLSINENVKSELAKKQEISNKEIANIVRRLIKECYTNFKEKTELKYHMHPKLLSAGYRDAIDAAIIMTFQKLPLSKADKKRLKNIMRYWVLKDIFPPTFTGVVISGFGDNEIFPTTIAFEIEAIFGNALKYRLAKKQSIDKATVASIIPFAQRDMVSTFIEGINPKIYQAIASYLKEIFNAFPGKIKEKLSLLQVQKQNEIEQKLKDVCKKIMEDYSLFMTDLRKQKFVNPITQTVSILPKDELAVLAETLINLTSVKRKMSLDMETVGGPIDVALISKGDGFVWIKRKHYFELEYNRHFIHNYYDGEEKI